MTKNLNWTNNIWSKQSKIPEFVSLLSNFTCLYSKKIIKKKCDVPRRSVPMLFSGRCNKKLKWHQWRFLSIRIFISTVRWLSRFFKLTNSHMVIPELTGFIQVDSELNLNLFCKGCSVPLPQWFHPGQDYRLSRKSMLGTCVTGICVPGIVSWKQLSYIWRITETYFHKEIGRYRHCYLNHTKCYWSSTYYKVNSVFCCSFGQPFKIPNKKTSPIPIYTHFWQFLAMFNQKKAINTYILTLNKNPILMHICF